MVAEIAEARSEKSRRQFLFADEHAEDTSKLTSAQKSSTFVVGPLPKSSPKSHHTRLLDGGRCCFHLEYSFSVRADCSRGMPASDASLTVHV